MEGNQFGIVLCTLLVILFLEKYQPYIGKIHVFSFLHACTTTIVSHMLLWENPWRFMTIYNEEYTSLSTFYQLFPYFSYGFGFYDLYYGFRVQKFDFCLHGVLFVVSTYTMDQFQVMHYYYPGIIMETSNIIYNFVPYEKDWVNICFGLTFLAYRCVFFPTYYAIFIYTKWNELWKEDMNMYKYIFGLAFVANTLNMYWGGKIIRKMQNKWNSYKNPLHRDD